MLLGAFKLLHFRSFPCGNVLATIRCGLDESFAKERDVMRRHRIELEKPIAKFDKATLQHVLSGGLSILSA